MSLTKADISQIRDVIREEVRPIVHEEVELVIRPIVREEVELVIRPIIREEAESIIDRKLQPVNDRLDNIDGRLEAIENDVKELYFMAPHDTA